jgi:hypothetical protein
LTLDDLEEFWLEDDGRAFYCYSDGSIYERAPSGKVTLAGTGN